MRATKSPEHGLVPRGIRAISFLVGLLSCLPGTAGAIQLGGTEVPRERFIVYLLIGNCNMVGRDTTLDATTHPRAWNDQIQDFTHAQAVGWIPAKAPLHRDTWWPYGGPDMHLLKRLIDRYPADYTFGIVKNADAGTSVDSYQQGQALYNEIVSAAQKVQGEATLGGIVMFTGDIESRNSSADQFVSKVRAMVEAMRADLKRPDLPFFMNRFSENSSGKGTYWRTLAAQIQQIPSKIPGSAVAGYQCPASGFIDPVHYGTPCYQEWTKDLVENLIAAGGDNSPSHPWFPARASGGPSTGGTTSTTPVAVLSAPPYAALNAVVDLDASGSSGAGKITGVSWDFGDGQTATKENVQHTWTRIGSYTISLTVTNDRGLSGKAQAEIEIADGTQPKIRVLSPQAGAVWKPGTQQVIRWTTLFLDDIKIFFSTDDGGSWTSLSTVDSKSPEWGALPWTVPGTPSARCRLMLEGYDGEVPTRSELFTIAEPNGSSGSAQGGATSGCQSLAGLPDGLGLALALGAPLLFMWRRRARKPRIWAARSVR